MTAAPDPHPRRRPLAEDVDAGSHWYLLGRALAYTLVTLAGLLSVFAVVTGLAVLGGLLLGTWPL